MMRVPNMPGVFSELEGEGGSVCRGGRGRGRGGGVLCVWLEHGAFFVDEHLVELGCDGGGDSEFLGDEAACFVDGVLPGRVGDLEVGGIQLPRVADGPVDDGFGSSAKWRLSDQFDHVEGMVRAEGGADAPAVDGDVEVYAVEVAEGGKGPGRSHALEEVEKRFPRKIAIVLTIVVNIHCVFRQFWLLLL